MDTVDSGLQRGNQQGHCLLSSTAGAWRMGRAQLIQINLEMLENVQLVTSDTK